MSESIVTYNSRITAVVAKVCIVMILVQSIDTASKGELTPELQSKIRALASLPLEILEDAVRDVLLTSSGARVF